MTKNAQGVSLKKSKRFTELNGVKIPNLPSADKLVEGELAINYAEGIETISTKNESGTVVTFSSDDYYTSKKLGSGFTGVNSAKTVTEAIDTAWEKGSGDNSIKIKNGNNIANGSYSIAIGSGSTANGDGSIAMGSGATANSALSYAEGLMTYANGQGTHAEGCSTSATTNGMPGVHAEGLATLASNGAAHAEGQNTLASGQASHAEGYNTKASGQFSHAEGNSSIASGSSSHAEGNSSIASGSSSHAEGQSTSATSMASHAEGLITLASGNNGAHAEGFGTSATSMASHAEGQNTLASGSYSHAEGSGTKASGEYSHAESYQTSATSMYSHAEGESTIASGRSSHAEGSSTNASGDYGAHAEGNGTKASGQSSHAEGYVTIASGGYGSHAEGSGTTASGKYGSHAEGSSTTASGDYGSHAEGNNATASGKYGSHVEGDNTLASGQSSHAEGAGTSATSYYAHAEGYHTIASSDSSHAEGNGTTASGKWSHAEGNGTTASGFMAHAEGYNTTASGYMAHVEGSGTTASGYMTHAEGNGTIAKNNSEHASGSFNISSSASTTFGDSGNTLFSVGNGTANDARHNAFEIRQNGDIYIVSGSSDIKLQDYLGTNITIDQTIDSTTSASTNAVSTSAVYGFVTSYTPSITVDQVIDETTSASTNPVATKAVYDVITDNEMVWANTFAVLSGAVSSHTEDTDIHVTANDKTNWNGKLDATAYTPTDLSNYYQKSETSGATEISNALGAKVNSATFTAHTADTAAHFASGEKTAWNSFSASTEASINDLSGQSETIAEALVDLSENKVDTATFTAHTSDTDIHLSEADRLIRDTLIRRTRKDFTASGMTYFVNTLKSAIADQCLEKYGMKVGDYYSVTHDGKTYNYVIAGLNTMNGPYSPYRLNTDHVGIIVNTNDTHAWNVSGNTYQSTNTYSIGGTWTTGASAAGYANCDLHYYLTTTVLSNVEGDLGSSNIKSHYKLYSNAVNTSGYNRFGSAGGCSSSWAWYADQKICALSEVQVYGSTVWSSSGYDTGEACRQLDVFRVYNMNEIFGLNYPWLRDVASASDACIVGNRGDAGNGTASSAASVAALILFA